jgi:hypothetical protein
MKIMAIAVIALSVIGCNNQKSTDNTSETSTKTVSPSEIELEWLKDPVEAAFEVQLPKGWKNDAYLYRVYELSRNVATSLSPDGNTALFFGDPKMPYYSIPTPELNENSPFANLNPLSKYAQYETADNYFEKYVQNKFGKLPGFKITGKGECPEYISLIEKDFTKHGIRADEITTTRIFFDYDMDGKKVHALLNGTVTRYMSIWMPGVNGISTTADPTTFNDMIFKIVSTVKPSQAWLDKEKQMRDQRWAQHQQNMQNQQANMQASYQSHQIRMQNMQQSFDQHNKNWQQQQNAIDHNHGMFLNMIKEENTVSTSSGQTFQVDNSHQKYYYNKSNNTYIGTDQHTTIDDLRKNDPSINPDNYEETQILR